MKTKKEVEREFLNDLWEDISKRKFKKQKIIPPFDELKKTEDCPEFKQLMKNRMIIGAFRYGLIKKQDYSKYELCKEAKIRIDLYDETKNLENLVDAANIIMVAFIHGKRLGHRMMSIDDGRHTPEI